QRQPIRVFIREPHDEVLLDIYRLIGSKRLPFSLLTLLHLNSHPDLQLPPKLTANDCLDAGVDGALQSQLSIGSWILPAAYAGHFDSVVWLRPPWSDQLPDIKRRLVRIGPCPVESSAAAAVEAPLRLDCGLPYFAAECMYCHHLTSIPEAEIGKNSNKISQFHLCSHEFSSALDCDCVGQSGLGQAAAYVVDVDLDYFSTQDAPSKWLPADLISAARSVYGWRGGEIVEEGPALETACRRREQRLERLGQIMMEVSSELDSKTEASTSSEAINVDEVDDAEKDDAQDRTALRSLFAWARRHGNGDSSATATATTWTPEDLHEVLSGQDGLGGELPHRVFARRDSPDD
ncbi:hypothetical protein BOX15_Mlig016861g1, partial [Macrostomum lignano]